MAVGLLLNRRFSEVLTCKLSYGVLTHLTFCLSGPAFRRFCVLIPLVVLLLRPKYAFFQAKSKASVSKVKEKARSKILELQSKVENLRAVLKKVTSTTATGSGGGGICDDLNIRHLLETPNKLSTSSVRGFSGIARMIDAL